MQERSHYLSDRGANMRKWKCLGLVGLMLGCGASTSNPSETSCVPGRQIACDCPDGSKSVQVCSESRTFEACQCGDTDSGGPDDSVSYGTGSGGRSSGSAGSGKGASGGDAAGGKGTGGTSGPRAYAYGDLSPCETSQSSLFFSGDSGDFIHPGQDLIDVARFTEHSSTSRISFYITPSGMEHGYPWDLDFSSEQLNAPLAVGEYLNAERYPFETYLRPGLSVYGDGRGCNELKGKFVIKRLEWIGGTLARVDIAFEQHCEGGSPALRGCLHYDSGLEPMGAGGASEAAGGSGGDAAQSFDAGAGGSLGGAQN